MPGTVVIEPGAGSGKTRVISRRAASTAAIGAVDPSRMLLITFTEEARVEMSQPSANQRGAIANNVHSVLLRQLMWMWPPVKDTPAPTFLTDPYRLVVHRAKIRADGRPQVRISPNTRVPRVGRHRAH